MRLTNILTIFIALNFAIASSLALPTGEREKYKIEDINVMDEGDLCPISSSARFHHHFVLIDATADLTPSQLKLLERLVLSESYLASMMPWDRLSIILAR